MNNGLVEEPHVGPDELDIVRLWDIVCLQHLCHFWISGCILVVLEHLVWI